MIKILLAYLLITSSANAIKVTDGQVIFEKLEDHKLCFSKYGHEDCYEALKRWVDNNPADAFKAGKISRFAMRPSAAIPFFSKALENKTANCNDRDITSAVISALDLQKDSNEEFVEPATKIGFDICYKEMKSDILAAATIDSNTFKNVCKNLMAKGELKGLKATKCKSL